MARSLRKRNKSTLRKKRVSKQKLSRKKYSSLRKSVKKQSRKYRKRTPKKTRKILSGGVEEGLKEILQSFNSKKFSTDYTAGEINLTKWENTSDNIHTYSVPKGRKWGPNNKLLGDEIVGHFIVIQMDGIYNPPTLKYKTIMMDNVLHENFKNYCNNSNFTYMAEELIKVDDGKKTNVFFVKKLPMRFFYEFHGQNRPTSRGGLSDNVKDTYNDIIPGAYDITFDGSNGDGVHAVNVFTKNSNGELYNPPLGRKFTMFFEKNCLENQLCPALTGFAFRTNILKNQDNQNQKRKAAQLWTVKVREKIPALLFNANEDAFYIDMEKFNDIEDNMKIEIFIYEWANVIAKLIIKFKEDVNVDNINDEFKAWLDYCMRSSPPFSAGEIKNLRENVDKILAGTHGYTLFREDKKIEIAYLKSPLNPDDDDGGDDTPEAAAAAAAADTPEAAAAKAAAAKAAAAEAAAKAAEAAADTSEAAAAKAAAAEAAAAKAAAEAAEAAADTPEFAAAEMRAVEAAAAEAAAKAAAKAAAEAAAKAAAEAAEAAADTPDAAADTPEAAAAEAAGDGVPEDVKEKFTPILQKFNLYLIDSVCRYLLNFRIIDNNNGIEEDINKIYDMIIETQVVTELFKSLQGTNVMSGNIAFKEIYTRPNQEEMAGGDSQEMFKLLQANIFDQKYYPKNTIISYIMLKFKEEGLVGLVAQSGGIISSGDFE